MKKNVAVIGFIIAMFAVVLTEYISDQDTNNDIAYSAESKQSSNHKEIKSVRDNIAVLQEGSDMSENKSLETMVSVKPAPERSSSQVFEEPISQEVPLPDNPDEYGNEKYVSNNAGMPIGELIEPMTYEATASIEAYDAISVGISNEGVYMPVPAVPDGVSNENHLEMMELRPFISVDEHFEDMTSDTKEIGVFMPVDSAGI